MSIHRKHPKPTLEDPHGLWCAWCLDYIPAGEEEQHHVYPTWSTRNVPGFSDVLHDWTVPVHDKNKTNEQCHRHRMQRLADAAAYPIGELSALPAAELDQIGFTAWQKGHLKVGVAIREYLRKTSEKDDDRQATYLTVELNAAAGAELPLPVIKALLADACGEDWAKQRPGCDP